MTTTTQDKFNTVTQSGSGVSWTDLSNLVNGASGFAFSATGLNSSNPTSNTIAFKVPAQASTIIADSVFESMQFTFECWRSDAGSPAGIDFYFTTNLGSANFIKNVSANEVFETAISSDGDRSYWGLNSYAPSALLDYIIDGTLAFEVYAQRSSGIAGVRIREAECTITYSTPTGRRGAIIASVN